MGIFPLLGFALGIVLWGISSEGNRGEILMGSGAIMLAVVQVTGHRIGGKCSSLLK